VELQISPLPSQEQTPVLRLTRLYPPQYLDGIKLIIKLKECEILNGFGEILFNLVFMEE